MRESNDHEDREYDKVLLYTMELVMSMDRWWNDDWQEKSEQARSKPYLNINLSNKNLA